MAVLLKILAWNPCFCWALSLTACYPLIPALAQVENSASSPYLPLKTIFTKYLHLESVESWVMGGKNLVIYLGGVPRQQGYGGGRHKAGKQERPMWGVLLVSQTVRAPCHRSLLKSMHNASQMMDPQDSGLSSQSPSTRSGWRLAWPGTLTCILDGVVWRWTSLWGQNAPSKGCKHAGGRWVVCLGLLRTVLYRWAWNWGWADGVR